MKRLIKAQRIFLGTLFFLCSSLLLQGQVTWLGNSPIDPAYRLGNTGIGSNSPTGQLHIMRKSAEQTLVRLQDASGGFFHNIWDVNIDTDGSYQVGYTDNLINPVSNKFNITKGGSVGIGTETPDFKLQINGNGKINSNLYVSDRVGIGTTSPSQHLTLAAIEEPIIRFEREGINWDCELNVGSDGDMHFLGGGPGSGSGSGGLGDNMIITGNGRVGIGMDDVPIEFNANQKPYLLYVKSGFITEELQVESGWCDYVFEENYKLLPLDKVENHLDTKGHLHNMPSAKEVEREGLELKSMKVSQQEKIEELFLHLIALNKRINGLETKNKALKIKLKNRASK